MFCDFCDEITCSSNTTIRITSQGYEVIIEHCEICKSVIERRFHRHNTIRIINKRNTK